MSELKSYPDYKDSGVPWLGEIPSHWDEKRMRFFVNTNPLKSELDVADDTMISFLPMEALSVDGGMNLEINKEIGEVYKGYTYFRNDDVVIAKITPCFENGKASISKNLTNGIGFGTTELHVLRPKTDSISKFVFYLIRSDSFMKIGESEMYGAGGQKRIPESFIKNFLGALPPLEEQRAIVEFLDTELERIDTLISKQQQLIDKLAEQRSAVITHAVTKGLDPDVPMKDSGVEWLGDIPKHWSIKKLKYLLEALRVGPFGSSLKGEDITDEGLWVYNQRSVLDKEFIENKFFISEEKYEELISFKVEIGDILLTTRGTIGRVAIVPSNAKPGIIHPCIIRFRVDEKDILKEYIEIFFNHIELVKEQLKLKSNATTIDVIYSYSLKEIIFPVPPIKEQIEILEWISYETKKIDKMSKATTDIIIKLQEFRSALITQAVTGKIDVRHMNKKAS